MVDDETFDEFYAKLNDIVNFAFNMGEVYEKPKIFRKILRSLIEDFRPKVIVVTESMDVDTIHVDELIGSLQSYEGMKRMIHMTLGPIHYMIHKIIIGSNIASRDGTMNFSLRRPK